MPLPQGVDVVTVLIGRMSSQSGDNGYGGTVTLTPSAERMHVPTLDQMFADPIKVQITDGQASVDLVASDARDCTVSDVTYRVDWNLTGPGGRISKEPAAIYLPRNAPVVHLEALTPVVGVAPAGVALPYVLSVGGLTGSVGAPELAAVLDPYVTGGGSGSGSGGGSGIPSGGWPLTSFDTTVQTLLGLAHDSVQLGGALGGTPTATVLRPGTVGASQVTDGSLPGTKLDSTAQGQLAAAATAVQPGGVVTSVNGQHGDVTVSSSGTVGDATTSVKGVVQLGTVAGSLGSATGAAINGWSSVVQTGDSRLSDARTPTAHTHDGSTDLTGVIGPTHLGTGTLDANHFLNGLGQFTLPPSGSAGALSTVGLSGPGPHTFDEGTMQAAVVEVDSPTLATVVLPLTASGGAYAHFQQVGAGPVQFQAGTGASLAPTTPTTGGQWKQVTARRRNDPSGVGFPTSGLLARFKGSDLPSSGAVSSWTADSAGSITQALTQATGASQPTVTTVAGYRAAHFNGTTTGGQWLQMTSTLLDLAKNRSTLVVYALVTYDGAVAGKRSLVSMSVGTTTSNSRLFLQKETDSSLVIGGRRLDTDTSSQVARAGTIPVGASTVFLLVGRLQWNANTATVYLNGAAASPAPTGYTNPNTSWLTGSTAATSNTASQIGAVGSNSAGSSEFWYGSILDLGFYSTDVDRSQLDTALQNAYPGLISTADYAGVAGRWTVVGGLA